MFDAEYSSPDCVRLRSLESGRELDACRQEVAICRDNDIARGLDGQQRVVRKNRRLINKILKEIDGERKD